VVLLLIIGSLWKMIKFVRKHSVILLLNIICGLRHQIESEKRPLHQLPIQIPIMAIPIAVARIVMLNLVLTLLPELLLVLLVIYKLVHTDVMVKILKAHGNVSQKVLMLLKCNNLLVYLTLFHSPYRNPYLNSSII
jgi:hypothetical protein